MKNKHALKWTAVSTVIVMTFFGAQAFAWQGAGKRHHGGMNQEGTQQGVAGTGQGYGCPAAAAAVNLTPEQIEQVATERKAFYSQTLELRQRIMEKQTELAGIMMKEEPDMENAFAVQKELSELQGQFDIERLEHMASMKKIDPTFGGMFGMGRGGRGCGMAQKMGCQGKGQTAGLRCW